MTIPKHMRGPRGSGRTTRQIQHLPQGGYFFCNSNLVLCNQDKAKAMGRGDVRVRSAKMLEEPYTFCGYIRTGAAVDHAYVMTPEEEAGWKLVKVWLWPFVP